MKNLNLAKLIFILLLIILVGGLIGNLSLETNEKIAKENELIQREKNIKEIVQVYEENFKNIGKTESAIAAENGIKTEDGIEKDYRKDYYFFGEEGKNLVKIKEYDGTYQNGTPILIKEVYIDLSKKVDGTDYLYNDVTEIYMEDWTSKVIDNYEFITPMEKVGIAFRKRYTDIDKDARSIALDYNNEISVFKLQVDDINIRNYSWQYTKSDKSDITSVSITSGETILHYHNEKYDKNMQLIEKSSIQLNKQKGSIDDVTIPEL